MICSFCGIIRSFLGEIFYRSSKLSRWLHLYVQGHQEEMLTFLELEEGRDWIFSNRAVTLQRRRNDCSCSSTHTHTHTHIPNLCNRWDEWPASRSGHFASGKMKTPISNLMYVCVNQNLHFVIFAEEWVWIEFAWRYLAGKDIMIMKWLS
jgi:hypothetical protein